MMNAPARIEYRPVYGPVHANEYRCDACGGIYGFGWSDEEAQAEASALWGHLAAEDRAMVCDDCFQIMGRAAANVLEKRFACARVGHIWNTRLEGNVCTNCGATLNGGKEP